jgi:hypothetical protein
MKASSRSFSTLFGIAALLLLGAAQALAAANDPPDRVARLAWLAAKVSVEPAGTRQWTQAVPNTPLTTGDRIYIDANGRAELQTGPIAVRAWRYTDLTVANLTNTATQLALAQGSLHVRTFSLRPDDTVEMDTPNGAITVTQPGDVRVDAYMSGGGTLVTVDSGAVEISGPGLSEILGAGECVHLVGSNPIHVLRQRMPGKDPFDIWSVQRDRAFLSSQSRQYVNPNTIGFDDLDRNGTWKQTPEYGPVWYPTDVAANWSPYSSGRWDWISPWGWTWVDADAWGFGPFHYGRWIRTGTRWGWVPGPREAAPIYSPAMVAFVAGARFAGEDGTSLSGWFPLGPGEPFYPAYVCSPGYFTAANLTNLRETRTAARHVRASNYFRYYHTQIGFHSIRYVHEKTATIAVPSSQIAAGQEIAPEKAIHPTVQQRERAWIMSHPMIAPTLQSLAPHPIASVPVSTKRPELIILTRPPGAARPPQITPGESSQPQRSSSDDRVRLIARTPAPTASPDFEQRLPALRLQPGRPLDPVQVNNLAEGRPAGPASAVEFPPDHGFAPATGSPRSRGRR